MRIYERMMAQREMDREAQPFFKARRVRRPVGGWLRRARKTLGLSAAGLARGLDVSPSMVFQLERSEEAETITLGRLMDVAEAMECELVYAVVPREGTFETQAAASARRLLWEAR